MMTTTALAALKLEQSLHPTPIVLELAYHTMVKPTGLLDNGIVTVASWEYPVDFLVIHAKDPSRGHPIILGRPWLATANDFIGCRDGEMTISNGLSTQRLVLYPPARPMMEKLWWLECPFGDENIEELVLPSDHSWALQERTNKISLT